MCGIVGVVLRDRSPVLQSSIQHLNGKIYHRGPDSEGCFVAHSTGMAMRRLSIIDPSGGHQPYFNEDKSVVAVFNGEIYNFLALRAMLESRGHRFQTKSDGEVIVHLYEEFGDPARFVDQLNGMFAFMLYDLKRKRSIIARDRIGIKPLYYYLDSNVLLLGSEIKLFIDSPYFPAKIDPAAVQEFLKFGYVMPPATILSNVFKLDPGSYIDIDENRIEIRKYALAPRSTVKTMQDEVSAAENFETTFSAVLQDQIISDVPLGMFLSGGLDSSVMAALLKIRCQKEFSAFTVKFPDQSYDESERAIHVTKTLGIKHHLIDFRDFDVASLADDYLKNIDDLILDDSAIPTSALIQAASKDLKVALGGDGGDELFGGYPTYYVGKYANWFARLPSFLQRFLKVSVQNLPSSFDYMSLDFKLKSFVKAANLPFMERHFMWKEVFTDEGICRLSKGTPLEAQIAKADYFANINRIASEVGDFQLEKSEILMEMDTRTFLAEYVLLKVDRISMRHGLEVRVPFLDNRMLDFSKNLDCQLKIKGSTTKYLLRKVAKKYFGDEIAGAPKKGFSPPLARWISGELNPLVNESLFSTNPLGWNQNAIKSLLDVHVAQKENHFKRIWALVVLNRFCQQYNLSF